MRVLHLRCIWWASLWCGLGGTLEIRKCLWVLILTQLFLNGMAFTKFINRKPLRKTRG